MTTFPGNTLRLKATFKDADGVLIDPLTVTLTVRPPDGDPATFTGVQLTNPSVGVYYATYTPTIAGHYDVGWQATTPSISNETFFDVQASRI